VEGAALRTFPRLRLEMQDENDVTTLRNVVASRARARSRDPRERILPELPKLPTSFQLLPMRKLRLHCILTVTRGPACGNHASLAVSRHRAAPARKPPAKLGRRGGVRGSARARAARTLPSPPISIARDPRIPRDLACRESRSDRDRDRQLLYACGTAPRARRGFLSLSLSLSLSRARRSFDGKGTASSNTSSTWTVVHPCRRSQTERRPLLRLSLSSFSSSSSPIAILLFSFSSSSSASSASFISSSSLIEANPASFPPRVSLSSYPSRFSRDATAHF